MLKPWPWSSGNVKQKATYELPHELVSYLNNLGLIILGNEFYLAVLKDFLIDFSLI